MSDIIVKKNIDTATAFKFIILLGLVSLFSDMVYEGSRSVIGPMFAILGASGAIVGFVAGLGELIGNVFRIFSGYFIDRTEKYWLITFLGYGCLFAIPLVAFAHTWKMIAVLIIIERVGKAINGKSAKPAPIKQAGIKKIQKINGILSGSNICVTVTSKLFGLGYCFFPNDKIINAIHAGINKNTNPRE